MPLGVRCEDKKDKNVNIWMVVKRKINIKHVGVKLKIF